jgi:hypothetical protein
MRKRYCRTAARRRAACPTIFSEMHALFAPWIPTDIETFAAVRHRLYCPLNTFWMFLGQVLWGNISCEATVGKALGWLQCMTGNNASPANSAYVAARKRLDTGGIRDVCRALTRRIEAATDRDMLWRGRAVKVVDGSSVSMPDTPDNQRTYPQPKNQKPDCGFPVMRLVAVFSLASGAMLDVAYDKLKVAERTLFRRLWPRFEHGDIVLADCGFCALADYWFLTLRGIDCVMRNHPRRSAGARTLKRLGKNDALVEWRKTAAVPKWLTKSQWQEIPKEIIVRQITVNLESKGFRTQKLVIATTLWDPKDYPKEAIAELYRMRWAAELFLRDIKITIKMDVLKCKTPDMVEKELLIYCIAYNLIRATVLQAAAANAKAPMTISFKAATEILRHWAPMFAFRDPKDESYKSLFNAMLQYIASSQLKNRPNRTEPRARKRRPKNYPLLNKKRHLYKEIPHRNRYTAP